MSITMGFVYAAVHLKYTIPPTIFLTFLYWPFRKRQDIYRILLLIGIAITATTPWDSYLIRRKIWTSPHSAIIGWTLFSIPIEEIFFFIIQTYSTSLLYLLISKVTFMPSYLIRPRGRLAYLKVFGQVAILVAILSGTVLVSKGEEGTYLGLILVWVGPFALLLWTIEYQFLINLPYANTLIPIAVPTLYLWVVDNFALRRGTWTIEPGTKLGMQVWDCLEVEEAVFFLLTNMLIVYGLVAFDMAFAVLEAFPRLFPKLPALPPPIMLARALLTDPTKCDYQRIVGLHEAVARLRNKSRSFYLASLVFSGRLRIDLILLYSFCRVADDLVDKATSESSAQGWILKLSDFLDQAYSTDSSKADIGSRLDLEAAISSSYPPSYRSALLLLPTRLLSSRPLYDLLRGFQTDLEFLKLRTSPEKKKIWPIRNESDLELYAMRVAGTVAELCLELVFYHSATGAKISVAEREFLTQSGIRMGIALQYVNIARDIAVDAAIGRVYIPTSWLEEEGLSPEGVIDMPSEIRIEKFRSKLLHKAFLIYEEAKGAIERLPTEARAPIKVAVESYMEIGRVLGESGYKTNSGRATVPIMRRISVAWTALTHTK